jgi:hypothetical protein
MFNVIFFGADGETVLHQTLPATGEAEAMDQAMHVWNEFREVTRAVMFHLYKDGAATPL